MALFQPTNVIPSSFTVGVVDAEKDVAQVSWQINGNSAMTAYEIKFMNNDDDSTQITTTGKITDGIPDGGFYGTDRFGQPKTFTWKASDNKTWNAFYATFTNGIQFKIQITQYWQEKGEEKSLESIDFSVVETKSTPQITVNLSDSEYAEQTALKDGTVLSTSIGYFTAKYAQAQGDAVRWVRWQIGTWVNGAVSEIISDTGEVNTPTLQFSFNGFFNKQSYAVRCLVESETGQQAQNTTSQNDGWIYFSIDIVEQGKYTGKFSLQCLPKENAALLSWTSQKIPPVVEGNYTLYNGSIVLDSGAGLTWNKTFVGPYTFVVEFLATKYSEPYQNAAGPIGKIAQFNYGIEGSYDVSADRYQIQIDPSITITIPLQNASKRVSVVIRSDSYSLSGRIVVFLDRKQIFSRFLSIATLPIESVKIFGGDSGARFANVTVYDGALSDTDITEFYGLKSSGVYDRPPVFKPSWYSNNYKLQMTANFVGNIDGGNVTRPRIYRQEVGTSKLSPIFYSPSGDASQLKDYGIASRKSYTYWLYAYDRNDAYAEGTQCTLPNSDTVATYTTSFKNYSLLVCDYDTENDSYHVRKQYLFAFNLSSGSIGNNNSPTISKNFTSYPTRMPDTANYASGTLQGLIGVIYTVPALIEQIGGIKHTARASTVDYFDSVDLEKELYDLSVAPYQLFLRDMKGHLRMVATNGAISMTQDLKKRQLPTTISLPWVEIGDASDVTIIQIPDDYGWNNDEQILDVRLDVDPWSGVLSATYPKPYEGTKFYLTGANGEILGAKTPVGITPAQFDLSDVVTEPNDGILSAIAKIKSEEN